VFVVEGFRPGHKRRVVNVMSATLLMPRSFCILPEVISPSIRTRIVHRARVHPTVRTARKDVMCKWPLWGG
jgi:hypothetical protein